MLLGCIGDDFTGSSDLANTLAKGGMRTVQYAGLPANPAEADVEAGVVALKTRPIPPAEAVRQSLAALDWLRAQGCRQFFFKYCSTFDSTAEGNIGPVTDALLEALGADQTVVCPAFPGTGRTIYQGHLFVGDRLLNESGMQNHPITPMTDPDIRRWLGPQTVHRVGHIGMGDVSKGCNAITGALAAEKAAGRRLIVVDAITDDDLLAIGEAVNGLALVTGGSGIAMGLPANFRGRGLIGKSIADWKGQTGPCVALSGSCSVATRRQVDYHIARHPAIELIVEDIVEARTNPAEVAGRLLASSGIPLAYTSAGPDVVRAAQARFGKDKTSQALERFLADVAVELRDRGVGCIITAGGETSGAVVEALAPKQLAIGPEIAAGVPALRAGPELVLALKSGNFGDDDFFEAAAAVLGNDA